MSGEWDNPFSTALCLTLHEYVSSMRLTEYAAPQEQRIKGVKK